MPEETTKKFIQLQDAQGTPIFPRVDLSNVENAADFVRSADIADFATSSDVETAFSEYTTEVVDEKLKSYSTTEQVNSAIATAVGNIEQFGKVIVPRTAEQSIEEALAAVENPKDNAIYLVPLMEGDAGYEESNGIHVEYLYVSNKWESIGSTKTNLEDYYTKEQVGTLAAGEAVIENNKLNAAYAPELKFQGNKVGNLFNSLNIIGIGNVTVDENGNVTLRLGENLNSSTFNTKDGVTNGTVSLGSYTDSGKHTLSGESSAKTIWLRGTNAVSMSTAEKIHLDGTTDKDGNVLTCDAEFELSVTGYKNVDGAATQTTLTKVFSGITAGATSYSWIEGGVTYATLSVTNLKAESNKAQGATGLEANVSVTINFGKLFDADGYVSFVLKQTAGGAGSAEFKKGSSDLFYLVTDTTTRANVTAVGDITLSGLTAKRLSGVVYLTGGTANYSATFENAGLPATSGETKSTVTFDNSGFAADATASVAGSATTATGSGALSAGTYSGANTVTAKISNINGQGTTKTATLSTKLLIEKGSTANSTTTTAADKEEFDNEVYRLTDAGAAWDSSSSLVAVAGLQVASGTLIYPSVDYSGLNEGLAATITEGDNLSSASGSIAAGTQPNYKNLTGARTYVRNFNHGGSKPGGTLTIASSADIKTAVTDGSLIVEVCKDITAASPKWYNIGFPSANNEIGKSNSTWGTTSKLVFSFADGNADNNLWVKITMTSAAATIKTMSFA